MNRRRPFLASCLALCLAFTSSLNPAFAGGLIPTERVTAQAPAAAGPTDAETRQALMAALVSAGVDREQARSRLAALTDAEVAQLRQNIDHAPAGGLWFLPFMLVAAVIGALIGTRDPSGKVTTDLFGQPRMATAP